MKSGDSQRSIRDRILSVAFQSLKENSLSDLQVGLLLGVLKPPAEDQMKLLSEQAAREFLAIYSI